jgi:hypothetical protein
MNEKSAFGKQFSTLLQKTNVVVDKVNSSRYDHCSIDEKRETESEDVTEERREITKGSLSVDNQQSLASSLSSFLHIDGNFAESSCEELTERSLHEGKMKDVDHSGQSHPIVPPSFPFYEYYESQHFNPSFSTRNVPAISLLPSDIERFEMEEKQFLSVLFPLKKEEFEKDPIKQLFLRCVEDNNEKLGNRKGENDIEETEKVIPKSMLVTCQIKVLKDLAKIK